MTLNLVHDPWIPVRTRSGALRTIRPAELVLDLDTDPILAPAWPRADFDVAVHELLVGLIAIAMPAATPEEWEDLWHTPPSVAALDAALAPFADAFALDGDGPRFLQEQGLDGEPMSVEALLIDAAGANAGKQNKDLLVRRGRYDAFAPATAAIALYAQSAFAPSGGAGNRTSMRGGGPMTTLVLPMAPDGRMASLWHRVWAHVPLGRPLAPEDRPRALPWLAPTLTSEKGSAGSLHESDERAHPLQAFFGMPRRLRLVFEDGPCRCALTGVETERVATGVVQRPWGVDYGHWRHPLTPYRREKPDAPLYSAKPKSGRMGPGDWVAAVIGRDDGLRVSAAAIERLRADHRRLLKRGGEPRVLVAGWAMNNMEAIEYLIVETPLHLAADPSVGATLDEFARKMAEASDLVAGAMRQALKAALFDTDAATDKSVFTPTRAAFFDRVETPFHDILARLAASDETAAADTVASGRDDWIKALRQAALATFDEAAPITLHDPMRSKPVAKARGRLLAVLTGHAKDGGKLFDTLELVRPPAKKKEKEKASV